MPWAVIMAWGSCSAVLAGMPSANAVSANAPHPSDFDPSNTTLFIGGLSASVTEEQLHALFGRFGEIIYVKIPPGKGCGFVQYVHRPVAETAMKAMQSQVRIPSFPQSATAACSKLECWSVCLIGVLIAQGL